MPKGPGAPEDGELAEAMRLVFAVFGEVQILAQVSAALLEARLPEGRSAVQWGVLNYLARARGDGSERDGAAPRQIARAFQVPVAAMDGVLASLRAGGLVQTGPIGRITITAGGLDFRDQVMADLAPDVAGVAAGLGTARLAAMLPDLAALRRVMDAMREG